MGNRRTLPDENAPVDECRPRRRHRVRRCRL